VSMIVRLHVEGLGQFAALTSAAVQRAARRAVDQVAQIVQDKMAVYPPEGDYNRPGPYPKRWYQRHWGPRWARADGTVGGRNTSQMLQKHWRNQWIAPLTRKVFNTVTYAPYVQAAEHQTTTHRRHGWQTDEDVANELERGIEVDQIISRELDKELMLL